ncbi:neuropeptide FF receptor 2-like [Branchiostoma lanceolatum]|uniref:NPFFR2 protein n=1 Tax=Branchiostoma lanceolatum TaxID=7740 RepID=A0A8J9VZM8_BRALA|nr:NPFFR2 [Branchiostoma lanceolatum]
METNFSFSLNGTMPDLAGWKQPLYVRCLLIIGYGAVFLLNIVGNPLVCLVVAKNKNMRTVTNLFIVNVAVCDFFVGGICMPFTLVNNLKAGWVFGEVMCTLLPMLMGMAVVGSVYTLVAIAVDRYLAVMKPTDGKLSSAATSVIIVSIWVTACVVMIPSAVQAQYKDHDGNPTCYETWPSLESKQAYTMSLFVLCYLVPLLAITGLYLCAGARLHNRSAKRNRSAEQTSQSRNQSHTANKSSNNARVFRMMVAVVALFASLHLPLWVATLLNDFATPTRGLGLVLYRYIYPIAHWLAYANSCVNPILYAFLNRNFRQGFIKAFVNTKSSCRVETPVPRVDHKMQGGHAKHDRVQCRLTLETPCGSRMRRASPTTPATAVDDVPNTRSFNRPSAVELKSVAL